MFVIASRRNDFVRDWRLALAASAESGATLLVRPDTSLHQPDSAPETKLVVIDMAILCGDRTAGLKACKASIHGVPIILGGDDFTPERELAALSLGMSACCDQRIPVAGLERIVRVVLDGGVWVSGAALPHLMSRLAVAGENTAMPRDTASKPALNAEPPGMHLLTERQHAVALLLAKGDNNKEIGRKLQIADRTVKAHLSAVFEKLNVADRLQLALLLNRHASATEN